MADEPPKPEQKLTSATMTPTDLALISENQKFFQDGLAQAFYSPHIGLKLYTTALQTWYLIRDIYTDEENKKAMEDWFSYLEKSCAQLGKNIGENNRYTGRWENYTEYLRYLVLIWGEVMTIKNKIGLSIKLIDRK